MRFTVIALIYLLQNFAFAQEILLPKKADGRWGYVNQKDEIVLSNQYEWAAYFEHSAACVKLNGKFGLINSQGHFLLEPKFDSLFSRPGAVVYLENGLLGIMDTLGSRKTEAFYQRVEGGVKSLNVKRGGHWANWKDGIETPAELPDLIFTSFDEGGLYSGCNNMFGKQELRECANMKMMEFIYKNIRYPFEAREADISGSVYISFMLDKQGLINNIEIKQNPGYGLGEEAQRVIMKMPKWVPAKVEGTLVKALFNLPVHYRLD